MGLAGFARVGVIELTQVTFICNRPVLVTLDADGCICAGKSFAAKLIASLTQPCASAKNFQKAQTDALVPGGYLDARELST
jgi:hypothetical protein